MFMFMRTAVNDTEIHLMDSFSHFFLLIISLLLLFCCLTVDVRKMSSVNSGQKKIGKNRSNYYLLIDSKCLGRFNVFFSHKIFLSIATNLARYVGLVQWSQTRGPREGPLRPLNIRKNEDFNRNICPFDRFLFKHWALTPMFFFSILMRPAIPCFQSFVAREILWVWGPWFSVSEILAKNFLCILSDNYKLREFY